MRPRVFLPPIPFRERNLKGVSACDEARSRWCTSAGDRVLRQGCLPGHPQGIGAHLLRAAFHQEGVHTSAVKPDTGLLTHTALAQTDGLLGM